MRSEIAICSLLQNSNKNYEFTATITNIGDKDLDVTVYPSVAISTMGSVTYVENTENLFRVKSMTLVNT